MSRASNFSAVILAAGKSTRMGRDKALLPWPPADNKTIETSGETFLSAAIAAYRHFADMVFVVAGTNESVLATHVYANGAFLVRNSNPERGQFSSLRAGLQEILNHGRDEVIITLVDRPPARNQTMEILLTAFETARPEEIWATVPEYDGKHGHPILAGREMIEAFLRASINDNARSVQQQNRNHIQYVAVEDSWIAVNINTPADYASLCLSR